MKYDDSICSRCGGDNLTDYPVCASCAATRHFEHRLCFCVSCKADRIQVERVAEPILRLAQNAANVVRWSNLEYAEAAKATGGVLTIRKAA